MMLGLCCPYNVCMFFLFDKCYLWRQPDHSPLIAATQCSPYFHRSVLFKLSTIQFTEDVTYPVQCAVCPLSSHVKWTVGPLSGVGGNIFWSAICPRDRSTQTEEEKKTQWVLYSVFPPCANGLQGELLSWFGSEGRDSFYPAICTHDRATQAEE